jgi:hypothetical protein
MDAIYVWSGGIVLGKKAPLMRSDPFFDLLYLGGNLLK